MTDGLLSIKERKKPQSIEELKQAQQQQKVKKFNPYKYASPNFINNTVNTLYIGFKQLIFLIVYFSLLNKNDHVINHLTKQHLKPYDKNLKKFNSTKALDSALDVSFKKKMKFFCCLFIYL